MKLSRVLLTISLREDLIMLVKFASKCPVIKYYFLGTSIAVKTMFLKILFLPHPGFTRKEWTLCWTACVEKSATEVTLS